MSKSGGDPRRHVQLEVRVPLTSPTVENMIEDTRHPQPAFQAIAADVLRDTTLAPSTPRKASEGLNDNKAPHTPHYNEPYPATNLLASGKEKKVSKVLLNKKPSVYHTPPPLPMTPGYIGSDFAGRNQVNISKIAQLDRESPSASMSPSSSRSSANTAVSITKASFKTASALPKLQKSVSQARTQVSFTISQKKEVQLQSEQHKTEPEPSITDEIKRHPVRILPELQASKSAVAEPPRRIHLVDTSERLRRDSELEVEYVKGHGAVLVRHGPQHDPQNTSESQPDIPDDKVFPVKSYLTRFRHVTTQSMKWVRVLDRFKLFAYQNDILVINAKSISKVSYSIECRKFYLFRIQNIKPEQCLEETILEVGGDLQTCYNLRRLLERRFGGIKVNKVESDFFTHKEKAFNLTCLSRLPSQRILRLENGSVNLSGENKEGVVEDHKTLHTSTGIQQHAIEALILMEKTLNEPHSKHTAVVVEIEERGSDIVTAPQDGVSQRRGEREAAKMPTTSSMGKPPDTGSQFSIGASSKLSPSHFAAQSRDSNTRTPKSVIDDFEESALQIQQSLLGGIYEEGRGTNAIMANNTETGMAMSSSGQPKMLCYTSSEPVRLNDLVIRIRDPASMKEGANKLNKLDVYDGPFRIIELPKIFDPTSQSFHGFDEQVPNMSKPLPPTQKSGGSAISDIIVKLHFPEKSKAKPWTKLSRLRPVNYIHPEVPRDFDAKMAYYWAKSSGQQNVVMNTESMEERTTESRDDRGVARIQRGAFVKVLYVSAEHADGHGSFEVEKLRAKTITRELRKEFPDEKMDDSNIVRYLKGGGRLGKSEVLVVKYLIHWAGWPSEDDTFERAQDNIPQTLIDEYNAAADLSEDEYVEIERATRPEGLRKKRKSEAK